MSSASNSCAAIDRLHHDQAMGDVFLPSKWIEEVLHDGPQMVPAVTPAIATYTENKHSFTVGLCRSLYPPPSTGPPSGIPSLSGSDRGLFSFATTGHLDLKHLMPGSVRRPREGMRPVAYSFETLRKNRPSIQSDPMELMLERMGERSASTKDLEIERFHEYAVFAMRGFGHFATKLGTGCYGTELEAALTRQSVAHREILSRQGIRLPLTNRIANACPILDWGLDYGSTPSAGALMLRDFIPGPATTLGEFRISGDKQEPRGKPPASIYLEHASKEQHNRFCGSVYGAEHIPERENARALLLEQDRRHDVLYTPDVIRMDFAAMVHNFIDLLGE